MEGPAQRQPGTQDAHEKPVAARLLGEKPFAKELSTNRLFAKGLTPHERAGKRAAIDILKLAPHGHAVGKP